MRSIAFADFLIGVGILFVLEGLMFAASPAWMRRAMKSALATPDNILARRRHRLGGGGFDPDLGGQAVRVVHRVCHARDEVRAMTDEFGTRAVQQIVSRRGPVFRRNVRLKCLRRIPRSGALWALIRSAGEYADMTGARPALSRRLRLMGAAVAIGAASMLASAPALREVRTASPTSPRR